MVADGPRSGRLSWLVAVLEVSAACAGPAVSRKGPAEVREVTANVPLPLETLRSAVLAVKDAPGSPVAGLSLVALDRWPPDFALTYADPGGYLAGYRTLPSALRGRDLLFLDVTDVSWRSDYETTTGPVPFRCGFVLHFASSGSDSTQASIYEVTPEVIPGQHWALAHEGIGFAKVDDIRLVEATVTDRQRVAAWLTAVAKR